MKICLANLHEATEQQVFDQCVNHLLTQMQKSVMDETGGCVYRGGGGVKCVAGCLIADNEYKREMDTGGDCAYETNWNALVARGEVPADHQRLIAQLQLIHDNDSVEDWEECLKKLSENFDLEFNYKVNCKGSV